MLTSRQNGDDVILDIFVGEHSLVVQNVVDKDVVALLPFCSVGVVVVVLQNFATFVDDPLMESFQVVSLLFVLVIPRC